jgi:MFS family permease
MRKLSLYRLTLIVCLAEIFGLTSISTFPAPVPTFLIEWHLSHTGAGWIIAAYYAGYMILVPVLAGITDRMDARKIMELGMFLGVMTALSFALLAGGFWSALAIRFLSGISLAGIYMPGLKVVSDHTEGTLQSRFISFYTASFSIIDRRRCGRCTGGLQGKNLGGSFHDRLWCDFSRPPDRRGRARFLRG